MTTPTSVRNHGKRVTSGHISLTLRRMLMQSLEELGGIEYLKEMAHKEPAAYLQFAAKCFITADAGEAQGLTIVVRPAPQYLGPIPGVLNSPVPEHVGPPRLVARQGEVIEERK